MVEPVEFAAAVLTAVEGGESLETPLQLKTRPDTQWDSNQQPKPSHTPIHILGALYILTMQSMEGRRI